MGFLVSWSMPLLRCSLIELTLYTRQTTGTLSRHHYHHLLCAARNLGIILAIEASLTIFFQHLIPSSWFSQTASIHLRLAACIPELANVLRCRRRRRCRQALELHHRMRRTGLRPFLLRSLVLRVTISGWWKMLNIQCQVGHMTKFGAMQTNLRPDNLFIHWFLDCLQPSKTMP